MLTWKFELVVLIITSSLTKRKHGHKKGDILTGFRSKIILLCFSLLLNTTTPINIPANKSSDQNFTPRFAIAADKNYKSGGIIRRYIGGAGLFVVIVVDSNQIVNL